MQLNPVIRGWANYHRHVASKRTFHTVDHAIFHASVAVGQAETPQEVHGAG